MAMLKELLEEISRLAAVAAATSDPLNTERRELADKLAISFKICGWAIKTPEEQIFPAEEQAARNWWRKTLGKAFPEKAEHFKWCSESELCKAAYEVHLTLGTKSSIIERAKAAAFCQAIFASALTLPYPTPKPMPRLVVSNN